LQGTDCDWNDDESFCESSFAAGIPILNQSNSTLAVFVATTLQCPVETDESSCNDVGFCFWEDNVDECIYVDHAASNPESPCVQTAPITIDWLTARQVCPAETTQEGCVAAENCAWNPDASRCIVGVLGLFVGVSGDTLEEAAEQLVAEHVRSGEETFTDEFNTTDPQFDWTAALDYDIPAVSCPDNTNATVCDYADTFARGVFGAYLYCAEQYSSLGSLGDCNSDPLCQVDQENDLCTYSDTVRDTASVEAVQVLTDSIPSGTDRNLFAIAVTCIMADDEESCSDANELSFDELCLWNPLDLTCDVSLAGIFQTVAAAGDDPTDGVCAFFSLYGETGCESILDEEACVANNQCEYSDNVCTTSGEILIGALLTDDPGLEEEISAIDAACAEFLTQAECEIA